MEVFQKFQEECVKLGFDLDLGIHLKILVAFATGQSRFLTVRSLPLERLQAGWSEATEGMRFAINFLRNNVRIDSPALLSSPFLLIVVAYFGHAKGFSLSDKEAAGLRQWALLANAKGRFSRGSSETILDQDLATIIKGGGAEALIDRVRLKFGRLDVTADDLKGRDQRSSYFKTLFVAFRARDARDWASNLQIALNHSGALHKLEFHHFFPKALLMKEGFTSREADDIANLTFIGGRTNRKISDKAPAIHVPPIIAKQDADLFKMQDVPLGENLLDVLAYRSFLDERRRRLASTLNDFLGALHQRCGVAAIAAGSIPPHQHV